MPPFFFETYTEGDNADDETTRATTTTTTTIKCPTNMLDLGNR